jgi:tetratricopeptide (TPR) repeat protein
MSRSLKKHRPMLIFLMLLSLSCAPLAFTQGAENKVGKTGDGKTMGAGDVFLVGIPADKAAVLQRRLQEPSPDWAAEKEARELEKEGRLDEAIKKYKEAIELGKYDWPSHSRLADIYEKQGRYELAIEELDWLIEFQQKMKKTNKELLRNRIVRKERLESLLAKS